MINSFSGPQQVDCLAPLNSGGAQGDVCATLINFNTAACTLRAIESLSACEPPPLRILVLDNASSLEDFFHLRDNLRRCPYSELVLYRSASNLGFAAGSNFLIDMLLRQPACAYVALLNNDAVAQVCFVSELRALLAGGEWGVGLAGGRMHRLDQPLDVDTLGIAVYRSLMPADRKSLDDRYVGPTGGCCMLTRSFIEDIQVNFGYVFDARFFCYCEDTDLVLRAVMLGYSPAYTDRLIALHQGQASSGANSDFVAYHGLRNAIWMHVKLLPGRMLLRFCLWYLLAHVASIGRLLLTGKGRLLWRIYRDAAGQIGGFLSERRRIQANERWQSRRLHGYVTGRFYRAHYAKKVLSDWMGW